MNEIMTAQATSPAPAETTVPDLRLAEALGYERPTNIRKLIKRHAPTLEAMGSLLHRGAPTISGRGRVSTVTEFHLNRAQAAFIVAKSDTKHADSLTVKMAEVFALFSVGGLVAADAAAQADLAAIEERERQRRRAIHEEEREGRADALALLNRGFRPTGKRKRALAAIRALARRAEREVGL